ncbi:MAG: palmitoyltransferase akr1 [Vezdaea aestivalis]|nr:MAG: palmitoyltransferase akr1 [Vezdaea aestivalis]
MSSPETDPNKEPSDDIPGDQSSAVKENGDTAKAQLPVEEDIMQLARLGEIGAIQKLYDSGKFDIHYKDEENITPLHWAAINNQYALCKYLIEAGAEVNIKGGESVATPAMWATQRCHTYVVALLLRNGGDLLLTDSQGYNILHLATFDGNILLITYLLHQNISVDIPDPHGHTSLMWAAYKGFPACVDLFLRWGADIHAADETAFTPLHWALVKGNQGCIQKLIEYGADRFAKTSSGKTPAKVAEEMKSLGAWQRALEDCGYDVDGNTLASRLPFASYVKGKRKEMSQFFFLWPFLIIWSVIMILSHMVIFAAIPFALTTAFTLQWVAKEALQWAPADMKSLHRTPFLAGVFAGTCFWVGARWLFTILPCYVPKLSGLSQQKAVIDELIKEWSYSDQNFCVQCMVRMPLRNFENLVKQGLVADQKCNILSEKLCGVLVYDPFTVVLVIWGGLQLTWVTMLLTVQLIQIARAQTTYENMQRHRHPSMATELTISAATAGTTTLDGAQLTGEGMGPDPAVGGDSHGHGHGHSHDGGFLTTWKRLLGLDAFLATAQEGLDGKSLSKRRTRNPFSKGIVTNCKDFLCDSAPVFGKRESGNAMLSGEVVNYARMYERPEIMRARSRRNDAGGTYESVGTDDNLIFESLNAEVAFMRLHGEALTVAISRVDPVWWSELAGSKPPNFGRETDDRSNAQMTAPTLSRNSIFQRLKEPCVTLSQRALQYGAKPVPGLLIDTLKALHITLQKLASQPLDEKLAEYVFFPLSHIFRQSKTVPNQALELSLQCVSILLSTGWKSKLPKDLGQQLLILFSFLLDDEKPNDKGHSVPEETQTAALGALAALFKSISGSPAVQDFIVQPQNVPALGHTVTTILGKTSYGGRAALELAAVRALDNFADCITDTEVLRGFLPGIISALTKNLQLDFLQRRRFEITILTLQVYGKVLVKTLGDKTLKNVLDPAREAAKEASWHKATASQILIALTSIIKHRNYYLRPGRPDAAKTLRAFCLLLFEQCRKSLTESMEMVIETLVVLTHESEDKAGFFELTLLMHNDADFSKSVQQSLHRWLIGLPRAMQSTDTATKQAALMQVGTSFRLLTEAGIDSTLIDSKFSEVLKDSVVAAIHIPKAKEIIHEADVDSNIELALRENNSDSQFLQSFKSVLIDSKSQKLTLDSLQSLIGQMSLSTTALSLVQPLISSLSIERGDSQVASFWLALNFLRPIINSSLSDSAFLNFVDPPAAASAAVDELADFGLSILSSNSFSALEIDWRLQALSLEALALQSELLGTSFQPSLIDALYPVVSLLGSPIPPLRTHAITTLNILTKSCEYASTRDLIVQNADYLTNAVGLKLSTFDITPQAPQVLMMMIRLAGAPLLPFLDDTIEAVFLALDAYHGYPKLAELLFSVLETVVDEAARAESPPSAPKLIQDAPSSALGPKVIDHRKRPIHNPTLLEVATSFAARASARAALAKEEDLTHSAVPRAPWGPSSPPDPDPNPSSPPEVEPSPSTSTPTLSAPHHLLHQILLSTPPHLGSPSAPLHLTLLRLIARAIPPLTQNEDVLLPILAQLWPAVFPLLHSASQPVAVAACGAVAAMCRGGGDFLGTRVREGWGEVRGLWEKVDGEMRGERERRGGVGKGREIGWVSRGGVKVLWQAVVGLMGAVAGYVRMDLELEREMVRLAGRYLGRGEITEWEEALRVLNPGRVDFERGVWRARRGEKGLETPQGGGFVKARFLEA